MIYQLNYKNGLKKKVDQQMNQMLEPNALKRQNKNCKKCLINNLIQNQIKLIFYKEYINQKLKIKNYQNQNLIQKIN